MRMKIVMINSLYTPNIVGGAEISTQILAESLASEAEVHVLTTGGQRRTDGVRTEEVNGVTVHRLPHGNLYWIGDARKRGVLKRSARRMIDLYNPAQIRAVRRVVGSLEPDVVHTHNLSGFGASVWTACAAMGAPVVHTLRDYSLLSPVSSPLANPLLSRLYSRTSQGVSGQVAAVVGISSHILNRHLDAGLFPDADCHVIPNGVVGDIAGMDKDFDRKPLRIGCFGRIEPEKGVRELIAAIIGLPRGMVESVTICGEGSLREELEAEWRHDGRFRFTGKVKPEEARERMAAVDVTFVPSLWEEPFGRVIIESYQAGTPVYASAVGGIPDVVLQPDRCLFAPGSPAAIQDKIIEFYAMSGEEKRQLQAQALRHSRRFTSESLKGKHLELYERTRATSGGYKTAAAFGR